MALIPKVNEMHDQAMELADRALIARRAGDGEKSALLSRQALDYEVAAANLVAYTNIEPTRSVLHRSAATLALECGETRLAERLVATALTGEPPDEIADELRLLLMEIIGHIMEPPIPDESLST